MTSLILPLLQAALGGFFLNMMNLYEDSQRPFADRVPKDWIYWTLFVFWPLAGAGLAYIYMASGYRIDGMLAFTTGLTAPTVLQTLMAKAAPVLGGRDGPLREAGEDVDGVEGG